MTLYLTWQVCLLKITPVDILNLEMKNGNVFCFILILLLFVSYPPQFAEKNRRQTKKYVVFALCATTHIV